MDMEFAKQVFIEEGDELLALVAGALFDPLTGEAKVNPDLAEIFRAIHTIKGSAALFGFSALVNYCHHLEDLLQHIRDGEIKPAGDFQQLLVAAFHYLKGQLDRLRSGLLPEEDEEGLSHLDRFKAYLQSGTASPAGEFASTAITSFKLSFQYAENLFTSGSDPAEHLEFLRQQGTVSKVRLQTHFKTEFDPTLCYLSLSLQFDTACSAEELQQMFAMLPDSCLLQIEEMLPAAKQPAPSEEVEVQQLQSQAEPVPDVATDRARMAVRATNSDGLFLRVESKKLDNLINIIGELVTQSASAELQLSQNRAAEVVETFASMQLLLSDLRDLALSMRMLPVADSFARLKLLAEELGRTLQKEVVLQIAGGETELDKGMLDRLAEPLLHLVRNAVDHGIETPEQRIKAGKNPVGQLRLQAAYEAGVVLIRLSDDGAGIAAEQVRNKALASGLITAEQQLDEAELYQLLFQPGFSTARNISNVSGRGVGLDVVKRAIDMLRGKIYISSRPGQGSVFEIRVPMTLSIIEGFRCSVGKLTLIVPHSMVEECLDYEKQRFHYQGALLAIRDDFVPVISLAGLLQQQVEPQQQKNLLVVRFGAERAALVVNDLFGEYSTVVKPVHPLLRSIEAISGSTLLHDGTIGFVLDIAALFKMASVIERQNLAKKCLQEG